LPYGRHEALVVRNQRPSSGWRRRGSGLAAGSGDRGAGVLFGLDVGEALLESGAGGIMTGDGLEGVLEPAAVTRQLVAGQGVQG
jgi:hypothetical protein